MFINAEPRVVSNGSEAFIPFHRAESVHQRLVEMTNNDVNAWSVCRPVVSSTSSIWDQQVDDFGNENFSVQSPYAGYFQEASLVLPRQPIDGSKTSSYTYAHKPQSQPKKNPIVSEQSYQDSATDMNFHQKQSPMLGHDYPQWSLGRGRGSFAEFSKIGNVLKDFPCQNSIESNTTFTPASSAQYLQTSFQEAPLSLGDSFNTERASPGTMYSSYSPMASFVNPQSLISGLSNDHTSSTKTGWWPHISSDNRYRDEVAHEVSLTYDGLPKDPTQPQQDYCDLWNDTTYVADDWTGQAIASSTISPKVLTLNVSSNMSSSSGSGQEGMMGLSGSNTVASSTEESSDRSGTETLAIVESSTRSNRQRQILPNAVPNSRRIVPILPSNDFVSHENTKKRSTKVIKSGDKSRRKSSPTPTSTPSTRNSSSWRAGVATPRPKKLEPKPVTPEPEASRTRLPQSSATAQATHHRDAKDDFLVRSKLAGMSYKEIRRQGKFSEAESTLRGRFRTLTKHKAARVRKPEWDDNDIRLLKKAVRKLTRGDPNKGKVPWKQVAEYISNNGGSYCFGNATCRKRWDELQARSER